MTTQDIYQCVVSALKGKHTQDGQWHTFEGIGPSTVLTDGVSVIVGSATEYVKLNPQTQLHHAIVGEASV